MTLDEAIKDAEKIAEENQRIVDTGIVFGDVAKDMLYFDDIGAIKEHLASYQMCAEEHRQLADWLKELKVYKSIFEDDHPDYEQISYVYVRRKIYDEVYRHG